MKLFGFGKKQEPAATESKKIFVYQIFYDKESEARLDPGFIPLDNTANQRPDWFEFWVIRNYLKTHTLQPNCWYGFLSSRFMDKTGISSQVVLDALNQYDDVSNVAVFSPFWDLLAYFLNPFEQGEQFHPGLMELSQEFFNRIDIKVDLKTLVTHSSTSVCCNYVIAKPPFWDRWLHIADRLFEFVEGEAGDKFRENTAYAGLHQTPMKTFIQERIASLILSQGGFAVLNLDRTQFSPMCSGEERLQVRRLLQTCDLLKREYCLTNDSDYLKMYWKIRGKFAVG